MQGTQRDSIRFLDFLLFSGTPFAMSEKDDVKQQRKML
jgi:hypothetical protein